MRELVIYECGAMSGLPFEEMNNWRVFLKTAITQVAENIGINVSIIKANDTQYQYYLQNKNWHDKIMLP